MVNDKFIICGGVAVLAAAVAVVFLLGRGTPIVAGARVSPVPVRQETIQPKNCVSLRQCDPGCYRGKQYCQKICTANVGNSSCSSMCSGDEICAMPDYNPERAYSEKMQKDFDAFRRKEHRGR